MKEVFPDFTLVQVCALKALGDIKYPRRGQIISAHVQMEHCLVLTAYDLGFAIGRCYSRAVDTMIRPSFRGSIK